MFGAETTWPEAIIFLGVLLAALFLIGIAVAGFLEFPRGSLPRRPPTGGRGLQAVELTDGPVP